MEDKKINPLLTGSAETMLQSFYARAKYSRKKNAKFYDAKAIELVGKIDYDFSKAENDSTMSNGVIARTIVFDELVKDFINKNPDCTVVNIACGLDTRFYRMDNGRITWYNVDLPETIEVRDAIYHESGRVSTIGISATDPAWADKVTKRGKMLFIIEGLSMYLTSDENAQMLSIIRDKFDNATVLMECLAKKWPILDVVGQKYDEGAFFLPQLMASAEAVKAGFDLIRDRARAVGASAAEATPVGGDLGRPSGSSAVTPRKGCASPAPTEGDAHVPAESDRAIIMATVKGDIHDIGKNIVKVVLENYGFTVIDLGRDVAPEAIVAAARDTGARLIGLSALMTTTVGAMERTIALVHEQLPGVAVMVGGAVITQEFAEQIGADFYAKDAAASTRVASTFFDD